MKFERPSSIHLGSLIHCRNLIRHKIICKFGLQLTGCYELDKEAWPVTSYPEHARAQLSYTKAPTKKCHHRNSQNVISSWRRTYLGANEYLVARKLLQAAPKQALCITRPVERRNVKEVHAIVESQLDGCHCLLIVWRLRINRNGDVDN